MKRNIAKPLIGSIREYSISSSSGSGDKIIASVLFERLPVVVPKIDPIIYAFREFSFRWKQQRRREYPAEFYKKYESGGKGDNQIDQLAPRITEADKSDDKRGKGDNQIDQLAPRITEADKSDDKRSLQRALDRRLYLLLHGVPSSSPGEKPVWHFPEKVYEDEDTLRKCAESALESVLGDLSHTYFVGNAPMGHMVLNPTEKRFFFKSQVIATDKFDIGGCDDHVWVTKDELLEYFPEQAEYMNQMLISCDD